MSIRRQAPAPNVQACQSRLETVLNIGCKQQNNTNPTWKGTHRLDKKSVPIEMKPGEKRTFKLNRAELDALLDAVGDEADVPEAVPEAVPLRLRQRWMRLKKANAPPEPRAPPEPSAPTKPFWAPPERMSVRQVYPLPSKGRTNDYYLMPVELGPLYLRYEAVTKFFDTAYEKFVEDAEMGGYGDVYEGNWRAAGKRPDMSDEYRLGQELLGPVETEWRKVEASWKEQGFDLGFKILLVQSHHNTETIDNAYKNHISDWVGSTDDYSKSGFEEAFDAFVEELMKPE